MVQLSNIFTYFTVSLPFSSCGVLIAISNLLQMTTTRWRNGSHSMQMYVNTAMKPDNTIKRSLVRPKDRVEPQKVCEGVYSITCKNCNATYIGETKRTLRTHIKEHSTSGYLDLVQRLEFGADHLQKNAVYQIE